MIARGLQILISNIAPASGPHPANQEFRVVGVRREGEARRTPGALANSRCAEGRETLGRLCRPRRW